MGKILIVDDDELTAKLYVNKLGSEGFQVTHVIDGNEALNAIKEKFDLIVLDIMIPKIDGLSLLQRIKAGINRPTPVLVYTNLLGDDVKNQATSLGASAVLFKADFTPFTFIDTMKKYLSA